MRMMTNFKLEPWNEPRSQERICVTGTLIASLTSRLLLAESWDATLASVCLWKLHAKRDKKGCEADIVSYAGGGWNTHSVKLVVLS